MSSATYWNNSDTRFERVVRPHMRIVISAPRKSGGAHLRCLLSMAYDLKAPPVSPPDRKEPPEIARWLSALPERSVSTCDLPFSTLVNPATGTDVQLIGIIRHPFDLFVSNFDVAQQRAARGRGSREEGPAWSVLSGEELGGEVAQMYAAGDFASEVNALRDWSTHSATVKFEDLLADPSTTLKSLSVALGPLTGEQIGHAVSLCPAENVVVSRPGQGRRMPSLPPGAWRDRIPDSVLHSLRESYSDEVAELGYDAS